MSAAKVCALRICSVTAVALLASCSSISPSQYVSPRVTGRVLDMDNRQPVRDALVRLLDDDARARVNEPGHGGRLVEGASAVRTDRNGRFELKSVRALGPFVSSGWYSVSVSYERSGYQTVVRSYTLADSTNTPSGEPLIETGDVLLPKPPHP